MMSENSQISSSDFNLSTFAQLPTVGLSPNMLVLQNIFKSAELTRPAVTINGQTKRKPKPQAILMTRWWMIGFYFSFLLPCIWLQTTSLPPQCFWPLKRSMPLPTWRNWAGFSCLGIHCVLNPQAFWASAIISCNVFMGPREFKACKTWVRKGWYQNPYLFWVLV